MSVRRFAAKPALALELGADVQWVPIVQSLVENGAPVLGLSPDKTMKLSMAAEELLAHLAGSAPGRRVVLKLTRQPTGVACDFEVEAGMEGLWAMNLTAAAEISPDRSMDHLGLLLASRLVDSFSISLAGNRVAVTLNQEASYPGVQPAVPEETPLRGELSVVVDPEPAEVTRACALALGSRPGIFLPGFFRTPGKVVDLMAYGQLELAILEDEAGTPAGTICWETSAARSIGFYGPCVFGKRASAAKAAERLVGHMIGSVARTPAIIVYSIMATPDLPPGDFERLATLDCPGTDREPRTLWFRHLREDMGCNVWAHPEMAPFLKSTYDRLFLMRTISETRDRGHTGRERSLFAAELDTSLKEARLRPLLDGSDIPDNMVRHVKLLKSEGFSTIYFSLDLGCGWQAAMGGPLMENGFAPAYVLPYAGDSDKAVFRYGDVDA